MKILTSNLSKKQNAFLDDEITATCNMARQHGRAVPEIDIILRAECNAPIKVDESTFQVYCEKKRREQSYKLFYHGNAVTVQGGGYAGALYGVYALLRKHLGAEWLGLNDCDIIFHSSPMPEKCDVKPAVPFRGMNGIYPELDKSFVFKFLRYMARNQWNSLMFHVWRWEACKWRPELLRFARLCAVEFNIGGHSMNNFLSDSHFLKRPDFFGERSGKRCIKGPVELPDLEVIIPGAYIQPCFTNPDACTHIAGNIAKYIDRHPEIKIFSLWPHDGANNWCQCPKCLKTTPYDQMLQLAKRILELVSRPIYIEALAYCSLLTIPREKENMERIYTIFCPYLRHYKCRFYEQGFSREKQRLGRSYPAPDPVNPDDDRDYGLLLDDWLEYLTANNGTLGIFAYYQLLFFDEKGSNDRPRYLRFPSTTLVADELRRLIDLGMQVYYDCSCPYPNTWPDARLYSFHSRILIDPDINVNALIKNQEQTFLGEAAPIINSITDSLDKGIREFDETIFAKLDSACRKLPEERGRRIKLWGEYVKLACCSAQARRQGYKTEIAQTEHAIIKLFKDNTEVLKNYVNTAAMIKHVRQYLEPPLRERKIKTNILA